MSATYLAWNGQPYPWPPPDGWYEASDGRWWADGTGPDAALGWSPEDGGGTAETLDERERAVDPDDELEGLDRVGPTADPGSGQPWERVDQETVLGATGSASHDPTPDSPSRAAAMESDPTETGTSSGDRPGKPLPTIGPMPGTGVWQDEPDRSDERPTTPLVLAGGAAAVAVVALIAFFVLSNDDGTGVDGDGQAVGSEVADTNSPNPSTSATAGGAGEIAPSNGQAADGQPDGSSASSVESTEGATSSLTTTATSSLTTTSAAPATSGATSAAAPPASAPGGNTSADDERVAEFRLFLEANGLSGQLLSDEDLIEFGTSFCVFAVSSENFDQYVGFREEAIAQSNGELTADELALAVDGAVSTFCPADARRLGIGQ